MRILTTSTTLFFLTTTLFSVVSRSSSAENLPKIPKKIEGKTRIDAASRLPTELVGKATVLKKGSRAPTGGILLTRGTLAHLMKTLEKRARTAEATAERTRRDARVKIAAAGAAARTRVEVAEARAGACLADQLRRERIYEEAIKRGASPPSFWTRPLVVGAIGAIVGGGICAGTSAVSR